eukprot:6931583-Lingulodinium_polyedra.AAC.1
MPVACRRRASSMPVSCRFLAASAGLAPVSPSFMPVAPFHSGPRRYRAGIATVRRRYRGVSRRARANFELV